MEQELLTAPVSYRNAMNTKLRMHRRDLAKLQRDMKTSASGFSTLAAEGAPHGLYSAQNQQSVRAFDMLFVLFECHLTWKDGLNLPYLDVDILYFSALAELLIYLTSLVV